MAIISIGIINKKLLWPLIYIIIYAGFNIYRIYNKEDIVTLAIESLGASIGQILTIFISSAVKSSFKREKKNTQNCFKDFFILVLIDILYLISDLFGTFFGKDDDGANYTNKFYFNESIEIIFLSILTYFILKYKYYKHHIMSIIAIVIFSTSIDIVLENFSHTTIILIINSILHVLADSLLFCYYKYLMEFKYYYFLDILLAEGIIHFCLVLNTLFIYLLIDSKSILSKFLDYYEENGIGKMLLRFFLSLIFKGFSIGIFGFLIVKELTPNHIVIAYELARIPSSIIKIEGVNRWIILTISIFQIIFLLFYLEIIEYNFCTLNINTKRSISERVLKLKDGYYDDDDTDEISFKGYDISEGMKNENQSLSDFGEDNSNNSINS